VEQVPLYAEAQNKELLGQAMLATGAAALTGGLAVLFFGPRQTTVALAPTKQGTSVLVSGAWP
jgi:uncharacterized protein YgbK (DUF1537 family)